MLDKVIEGLDVIKGQA